MDAERVVRSWLAAEPSSRYATDLTAIADTLRDGTPPNGPLAAFLRAASETGMSEAAGAAGPDGASQDGASQDGADGDEISRVDVRRQPLTVRDGCAPDRMPPGRWPSDTPLVVTEQFAVNEILGGRTALSAVHAPPGAGIAAVFRDVIAALVAERAARLADLPSPHAGFGAALDWEAHAIAPPVPALTGFEIVLAAPDDTVVASLHAHLAGAGARWRERAAQLDYFTSTARLALGDGAWALIAARLGGRAERRSFVERFWHGTVHGADVLFPVGESMPATLTRPGDVDWPGSVERFREAVGRVRSASSERTIVAAALTRLSALERARAAASATVEAAQARAAELAAREPAAREKLVAAEERRRACQADLDAHRRDRPGLVVAVSTGLRAGRDWYAAHGELREACAAAARARDAALAELQSLRAGLAAARKAAARAGQEARMLTAGMEAPQAAVTDGRRRWGGHVPEGSWYDGGEDAALALHREDSALWADTEFGAARAELFLSALALHKAFIMANADTLAANLGAWADMLTREGGDGPPPDAALAAWQSFFLVVPAMSVTFESIGSLLPSLGGGSLGWLLADGAGQVPPQHVAGALWRANHAVLAGADDARAPGRVSAQRVADRTARYGTWLPDGPGPAWVGLPLGARQDAQQPGTESDALLAALTALRERARTRDRARSQRAPRTLVMIHDQKGHAGGSSGAAAPVTGIVRLRAGRRAGLRSE